MVILEMRRILRRNPVVHGIASLLLAIGFAGSALTALLMLVFSATLLPGLRPLHYGTIAEIAAGGASKPMTWKTISRVRGAVHWPGVTVAAYSQPIGVTLRYNEKNTTVSVAGASSDFLPRFSTGVAAGTGYTEDEFTEKGTAKTVISYKAAQKLFGNVTSALNQTVIFDGDSFLIVGVAPRTLQGLWSPTDFWISPYNFSRLDIGPQSPTSKNFQALWKDVPVFYLLIGSEKMAIRQQRESLSFVVQKNPDWVTPLQISQGLTKDPVEDLRVASWARMTLLLSLILILASSGNYCGIILADLPRRTEEFRLKQILGSSIRRIIVESIIGSSVPVVVGFLGGAALTSVGIWFLFVRHSSLVQNMGFPTRLIVLVLGVELLLVILLSFLIGIVPALRLLRDVGAPNLGYTATGNRKVTRTLQAVVAIQITSCVAVCLLASMVITTIRTLSSEKLGFEPHKLTVLRMGPAGDSRTIEFNTGGSGEFPLARMTRRVLQSLADSSRGALSVAATSCAPLDSPMKSLNIQRMDQSTAPSRAVSYCVVTSDFFQALRNPIVEGRGFSSSSTSGDPAEVVINQKMASEFWPGRDPLHQTITLQHPVWDLKFTAEVIGVTEDMHFYGRSHSTEPTAFIPLSGNAFTLAFPMFFVVNGAAPERTLRSAINQQANIAMPSMAVSRVAEVGEMIRASELEQSLRIGLVTGSALLITLIAFLGLHAVLLHFVNTRRKEIAVRLCFGATPQDIRRLVIRQAMMCSVVGTVAATALCRVFTKATTSDWLGFKAWSWTGATVISVVCIGGALLLSLWPANAAVSESPAVTLKEQ